MTWILTLVLVFVAVAWSVFVVVPILMDLGTPRPDIDLAESAAGDLDPMGRFATPGQLRKTGWSVGVIGATVTAAALVAGGVTRAPVLALACSGMALVASRLPRLWLLRKVRRRQAEFEAGILSFTLALAGGLKAGSSLGRTLKRIARDTEGVVGEELTLVLQEHRLGLDLVTCLERLNRRMPLEDVALLVTSVRVTRQSGGSLAEVLTHLADTVRERIGFQAELKSKTEAGRFEALAMAMSPVLAFVLLFYISPDMMKLLFVRGLGWIALGVAFLLEMVGYFWVRKILDVEM